VGLAARVAVGAGRILLLMTFAAAGTILLVRFAPGFFSDAAKWMQSTRNPHEWRCRQA
jgi:hypothetical protein